MESKRICLSESNTTPAFSQRRRKSWIEGGYKNKDNSFLALLHVKLMDCCCIHFFVENQEKEITQEIKVLGNLKVSSSWSEARNTEDKDSFLVPLVLYYF
jgi:hypothetical protein